MKKIKIKNNDLTGYLQNRKIIPRQKFSAGSFLVIPNKSYIKNLNIKEKALYLTFCLFRNSRDGMCFPSVRKLMSTVGFGTSTHMFYSTLKGLKNKGLISVVEDRKINGANIYVINRLE